VQLEYPATRSAARQSAALTPTTTGAAESRAGLVTHQGDGLTVRLPGNPQKTGQTKQTSAGPVTVTSLTVTQGQRAFGVATA
jgi:hypothetical protein